MAITYGFFDSINGDRKYTASDIGRYLQGIVSSGVYPDDSSALQVRAVSGMEVSVQTGRAMLDYHYMENDSPLALTLNPGSALDRIDAIVMRLDMENRLCEIAVKEGTPATTPAAPMLLRTDTTKEYMLASVYVTKLVTAITQEDISDTRHDSTVCGWVRGVIRQETVSIPVPTAATAMYIPHVNEDGDGYVLLPTDTTLSYEGAVADAAAVGQALEKKLPKTGGNVGALQITSPARVVGATYPTYAVKSTESGPELGGLTFDVAKRRFYLRAYNADMDAAAERFSENFTLPDAPAGLTATKWYTILTTKAPVTIAQGGHGATNGATGLKNLLAAGGTVLSSYQYGTTLPAAGTKGRIFFKKV